MFNDLANKDFRDAFLEENIKAGIIFQLRALREKRGWLQSDLAREAGKTQSVIARLEDPSYGKFTLRTLLDLAKAFDVALLVKLVPYTRLVAELQDVSSEALAVASYDEECRSLTQSAITSQSEVLRAAQPSPDTNSPARSEGVQIPKSQFLGGAMPFASPRNIRAATMCPTGQDVVSSGLRK